MISMAVIIISLLSPGFNCNKFTQSDSHVVTGNITCLTHKRINFVFLAPSHANAMGEISAE